MTKKPDTASALAGILKARRGDESPAATEAPVETSVTKPVESARPLPPSPAPLAAAPRATGIATLEPPMRKGRGGKSSDPSYNQFSIYLPKALRKKVGRALDDADTGQDFSELVEELLTKWLSSNT